MKKVIVAELAVAEVMTGLTSYSVRSKEVEGICHDLFEDSGLDTVYIMTNQQLLQPLLFPGFTALHLKTTTQTTKQTKVSQLLPNVMYEPRETPEAVLEK